MGLSFKGLRLRTTQKAREFFTCKCHLQSNLEDSQPVKVEANTWTRIEAATGLGGA